MRRGSRSCAASASPATDPPAGCRRTLSARASGRRSGGAPGRPTRTWAISSASTGAWTSPSRARTRSGARSPNGSPAGRSRTARRPGRSALPWAATGVGLLAAGGFVLGGPASTRRAARLALREDLGEEVLHRLPAPAVGAWRCRPCPWRGRCRPPGPAKAWTAPPYFTSCQSTPAARISSSNALDRRRGRTGRRRRAEHEHLALDVLRVGRRRACRGRRGRTTIPDHARARAGQLEHGGPAEAVADGGDAPRVHVGLPRQLVEAGPHAGAQERPVLLVGPGQRAGLLAAWPGGRPCRRCRPRRRRSPFRRAARPSCLRAGAEPLASRGPRARPASSRARRCRRRGSPRGRCPPACTPRSS